MFKYCRERWYEYYWCGRLGTIPSCASICQESCVQVLQRIMSSVWMVCETSHNIMICEYFSTECCSSVAEKHGMSTNGAWGFPQSQHVWTFLKRIAWKYCGWRRCESGYRVRISAIPSYVNIFKESCVQLLSTGSMCRWMVCQIGDNIVACEYLEGEGCCLNILFLEWVWWLAIRLLNPCKKWIIQRKRLFSYWWQLDCKVVPE